jgi:hypothetical protein
MESQTPVKENSELHPLRRGRPITHASIKKLGEDLQLSVERFLPRISAPYKKVTCLLIAWAHTYQQDESGVRQDFDEFRGLMLEHQHVQVCVRKELASKLEQLQSDIHYCYQCFEWVVGEHWNGHCQEHLSAITSKRCGSITYCHTLVRPGYYLFHLGDERLPASERWESWTRDRKLWVHLDEHINKVKHWPSPCPHPLCDLSMKDAAEMRYHFIDDHGMCRTRLNVAVEHTTTLGGKRKRSNSTAQLEWVDSSTVQESPDATKSRRRLTKSPQEASPTICPKLLGSPFGQTLGQDLQDTICGDRL